MDQYDPSVSGGTGTSARVRTSECDGCGEHKACKMGLVYAVYGVESGATQNASLMHDNVKGCHETSLSSTDGMQATS
eukprot:6201647-Pleurochrysis_carterae.AAC.1